MNDQRKGERDRKEGMEGEIKGGRGGERERREVGCSLTSSWSLDTKVQVVYLEYIT